MESHQDGPDGGGVTGFEFGGINHLALVCRDMARTVDFYSNVLGMPLIKTIELPAGMGQHFFFDCGGGDALAFFWFPDAPDGVPGVSAPAGRPDQGSLTSAVALHEPRGLRRPAREDRRVPGPAAGRGHRLHRCGEPRRQRVGDRRRPAPGVFVRSIYFQDPDGILLEFACWTRPLGPGRRDPRPGPRRRRGHGLRPRCPGSDRFRVPRRRRPSSPSCTTCSSRTATRWPSPGTSDGTPGDWWTVVALVPDVLEHSVQGFGLYQSPKRRLDPVLRELAQSRVGWA